MTQLAPLNRPPKWRFLAKVERIVDGDTIDVQIRFDVGFRFECTTIERIRLARIDAPEPRGDTRIAGKAATAHLREMIPRGTVVMVETSKGDAFDRWIGEVATDGNINVSDRMVDNGHAKYKDYD